jgi:magnesium transporter
VPDMQVDAYIVTKERLLAPVDAREMSDDWFLDEAVRWIKITSATPEEVERALRPLELHPRIVNACANPQPPQVEVFEKVLFMAMPLWKSDAPATSSVRFVCVATTLITIQDESIDVIEERAERLLGDQCLLEVNTAALTLDLAGAMLKSLVPARLILRADVDAAGEALEKRPGEVDTDDLLALKRRATRLSNLLEDQLYCLVELQEARSQTLQLATVHAGFQELVGDIQKGQRLIARTEDRIRDLRQSSLSFLQEMTNRRLNILAVLSAIYLPSTLIAGIYGMNFEDIPITKVAYGYFIVLALMIGLVVGQIWFFYRHGWLK